MDKFIFIVLFLFIVTPIFAQVDYTANDQVTPYDGGFRPGLNSGFYPGFTDEDLADLAAGNPMIGNKGVGAKALRPGLFESFTAEWGVDSRIETFQHYLDLDIKDNTVIVGFPSPAHQDPTFYCPDVQSQLFANMYEPIWDDGSDGTPYNEDNYYAAYLWEVVNTYKDYVGFWEIWNEPGFDYTGSTGYLLPGNEGNWWENNPDPCDYKLRAPIFNYVRLLRISWEIIKSVDETGYVVVSGTGYPSFLDAIMRNTDNPTDGSVTDDYPLGGGAYFDVMGFHSYPHFDGSLREYSNEINGFINYRHSDAAAEGFNRTRGQYQDVLDVYGYDGTTYPEKLWTITECNLPRAQYGEYIGSPEAQRNFMIKAYVACAADDFVQLDIYKIAEDLTDETAVNEFDIMGLYYQLSVEDGYFNEANDAGIAMRTATQLLFGKDYDADQTAAMNLPEDVKGGAFADEFGNFTYVIWAKTDIDMSEEASATYSFPTEWEMNDLVRREWDFGETSSSNLISNTDIPLTGAPIFLSEQVFSADVLLGCAPLTVQFTDLSELNAVSWEWEFAAGENQTSSNVQNPEVELTNPGNYTATMQAFDADGNLLISQSQEIIVVAPTVPMFSSSISGPIISLANESSINSQSFFWEFGDGITSTEPSPTHVYYESGEYTLSLTTTNECGPVTYSETVNAIAPSIYYVEETADDHVPVFEDEFRAGYNFKFYPNWTDEDVANIAAGNTNEGIKGVGAKSVRTFLGEFFVDFWDYDVRLSTFQHYANLGIQDNTLTLDFPSETSKETTEYCPGQPSKLFNSLYLDIWDDGTDGTPINEENPYATYVYNMVLTYGPYVKYWEIVNAPDFDLTGELGYLPPGEPGNWWENNPEPCDYQLRAPIFHYIRTLRISYEVIKFLEPEDYVAISGIGFPAFLDAVMRNTDNPADGSVAPGYELGGGAYFDVVGIKSYPHFDGATSYYDTDIGGFAYDRHSDAAADGISLAKGRFEEVLENYGYGTTKPAKEWIIAEANVPRFAFDEFLGGEEVQRNWITKAYIEAQKNDIHQFNIFNLTEREYAGNANSPFDVMGLYQRLDEASVGSQIVNDEGIALRTTSLLLFGRDYDHERTLAMNLPEDVNGAAFIDGNGDYNYVLWARTDTDNSEANLATYSFPSNFDLDDLYKREWDFGETETTEIISSSNISLTALPIFLNENAEVLQAPVASFTSTMPEGCPGLEVSFTNTSIGDEVSYLWEFEGGIPASSTASNPVVSYPIGGDFTVSLTVTNAVGSHTVTSEYINITTAPQAAFNPIINGAWVDFENNSVGSYYHNWNFGDESNSTENVPQHFYFENGEYEVTMVAFNDCFSDTTIQTITIAAEPTARFQSELSGDCNSPIIEFQDESYSSPEEWFWEFQDGTPATSNLQSPDVSFPQGGIYEVKLTVSNEFGSTTETKYVNVPSNQTLEINRELCDTESEEVNGVIFDVNHTDETFELETYTGCDSIVIVHFEFFETYEENLTEILNAGETYTVGNSVYTQTGIYSDTLQTLEMCDSIVNLDLTILSNVEDYIVSEFDFSVAPNPFSEHTQIEFTINENAKVSLDISDVHGREVMQILSNKQLNSNNFAYPIKAKSLIPGVYFCRLTVGDRIEILRIVRL
jgi:PKD repeat protein